MNAHPALYDEDAEDAVLSACLQDPAALRAARSAFSSNDFFRNANALVFNAIVTVTESGSIPDPVTVAAALTATGDLARAGGKERLGYLLDIVPTSTHVREHAAIVHEKARERRARELLLTHAEVIGQPAGMAVDEVVKRVQSALSELVTDGGRRGFRRIDRRAWQDLLGEIEERGNRAAAGEQLGIGTGYPEIDSRTHGFRDGEFVVVGGRPKGGKTALSLNIVANNLLDAPDFQGAIVSCEMLEEELMERFFNAVVRVTTTQTATGALSAGEYARMKTMVDRFSDRLHIADEAFPTLDNVIARAIDLKAREPGIQLLVVDYLQRVTKRLVGRRGDEEIAAVTAGLKGLAKTLRIPVIAPAQVNYKTTDKRKSRAPELADLQGGSGMAQDANFVFLLHRPGEFDPNPTLARVLQVSLAASRRTATFSAALEWEGRFMAIDSPRRRAIRGSEELP